MTLPLLSCVSYWILVKNQEKKECWIHRKGHFLYSILKEAVAGILHNPCVIEASSSISPAPGQGVIHKFCLWRSRRFVRRA